MNKRFDIGVEPNTVFGEFNKDTLTLLVTGEENKEMDKMKFWEFVIKCVKGAESDYGRVWFDYECDNSQYTVNIRDKIALPTDSSDLFSRWETNLIINPYVHTENVINMRNMFWGVKVANPDVSNWDVSNVFDMSGMFGYTKVANPDVSNWSVNSVTDMRFMFVNTKVANPDVSNWNVENVITTSCMFYNSRKAKPDISKWNTKNLEDVTEMFKGCDYFPDISHLNLVKIVKGIMA